MTTWVKFFTSSTDKPGDDMPTLLAKIRRTDPRAAQELERQGFRSDSDVRSLNREDLRELFPGVSEIKRRKAIFETIHERRSISTLLKELKEFVPDESLRAALANNGVLVDYLTMMKDIQAQVNNVQDFLNAHVALLEDIQSSVTQEQPETKKDSMQTGPPTDTNRLVHCDGRTGDQQQGAHGLSLYRNTRSASTHHIRNQSQAIHATVKYKMIVSGKTFEAHQQLMDKVKNCYHPGTIQFTESDQDFQVVIVFCPISSRVGSDAEAVLTEVTDEKPVILVLMHHTYEAKPVSSMRTWESKRVNVVKIFNVFFHETKNGLLTCNQNDTTVSEIQNKLVELSR